MNLKLDSRSIRIRLKKDEAFELAREGKFEECFPLFDQDFGFNVRCKEDGKLSWEVLGHNHIELLVPQVELDDLLFFGKNKSIKEVIQVGERTVEIRFEIDRFSSIPHSSPPSKW